MPAFLRWIRRSGNLVDADVHVRNGQILAVGKGLRAPSVAAIDGRAMIAMPGRSTRTTTFGIRPNAVSFAASEAQRLRQNRKVRQNIAPRATNFATFNGGDDGN